MKPTYIEKYIEKPEQELETLLTLDWLQVTEARKELFLAWSPLKYTYGSGENARTYTATPFNFSVLVMMDKLNREFGTNYDVCFLNRYDEQKHQLGWHADIGVESTHPIAVISFGAEREIHWKHKDYKGPLPPEQKVRLASGSLFTMPAGFQENYLHKIPRSDRACGVRVSLTFRKYK